MAEKLYWNLAKISITCVLLITAAILSPVVSQFEDNIFVQQPRNITAMEGETVRFNCNTTNNVFIAFWIINGSEHGWSDFRLTPTYTFDLQDNSLTINSVQKGLNGTSFQCVVAQQASEIGYLTVLSGMEQFTSSSSLSSFATTSRSDGTYRTASSTETRSTHSEDPSVAENTPHRNSLRVHVAVAITGIIVIITIMIINIFVCFVIIHKHKRKPESVTATPPDLETFTMVTNEVYGNVKHMQCKITVNEAYNQRNSYLAG